MSKVRIHEVTNVSYQIRPRPNPYSLTPPSPPPSSTSGSFPKAASTGVVLISQTLSLLPHLPLLPLLPLSIKLPNLPLPLLPRQPLRPHTEPELAPLLTTRLDLTVAVDVVEICRRGTGSRRLGRRLAGRTWCAGGGLRGRCRGGRWGGVCRGCCVLVTLAARFSRTE